MKVKTGMTRCSSPGLGFKDRLITTQEPSPTFANVGRGDSARGEARPPQPLHSATIAPAVDLHSGNPEFAPQPAKEQHKCESNRRNHDIPAFQRHPGLHATAPRSNSAPRKGPASARALPIGPGPCGLSRLVGYSSGSEWACRRREAKPPSPSADIGQVPRSGFTTPAIV